MRTVLRCLPLICACAIYMEAEAQKKNAPIFGDHDRVCFVGNSITQSGGYHHYIYLYQATRFPDQEVRFFNCGVGGDTAPKILARMEEDVFVYKPNQLVLMIGMNDARGALYSPESERDPEIDQKRNQLLQDYRRDTDEIVRRFKKHTPNVILIKPSIYDQTAQIETENLYGKNDALGVFGDHLGQLAEKYDAKLVDFWSILNRLNAEGQRKDPMFTIIGADRVHPGLTGHMVMAYQFLKDVEAPEYVSSMVIDKSVRRSNRRSINCEIEALTRLPGLVSFTCRERSLPYPVPPGAEEAFLLIPFNDALNKEILKVDGLEAGNYDLSIDGLTVGTYPASAFNEGINLALNERTPQYRQALKVMAHCMNIKRLQGALRVLKRVEYVEFGKAGAGLPLDSVAVVLADRLEHKYAHDRYEFNKKLFSNYLDIRPREDEIWKALEREEAFVNEANNPRVHVYEIRLVED